MPGVGLGLGSWQVVLGGYGYACSQGGFNVRVTVRLRFRVM